MNILQQRDDFEDARNRYIQTRAILVLSLSEWLYERKNIDVLALDIKVGYWPCSESPIRVCFYYEYEDPALDNCVVCNLPHERK